MKISYNWLKQYISPLPSAEETAELLTNCGLEVESMEEIETIKGGLKNVVIGEVKSKNKHPSADRLSVTTVDIGTGELLNIVCGAPNVETGQKVVVAKVGAILFPVSGETLEIKKSKIRGELSEGMLCAEDEIGVGTSHSGILVLPQEIKTGTSASEYFKVATDFIYEIGLTPNRADATSHMGVALDLIAILRSNNKYTKLNSILETVSVDGFKTDNYDLPITVLIDDLVACRRYSGVSISDIKIADSPKWLKDKLNAIGIRAINNIVDVTNYVMYECGQPLHAFDYDKIKGQKIIVKKLSCDSKFTTLDSVERNLTSEDLLICDSEKPLCIAGVYGGLDSGVSENTKNIFLESAHFSSSSIRKTSKRLAIKTDSSFRFERGADPNNTIYALKRAALLIKEISGSKISSEIIDAYPAVINRCKVPFSFQKCFDIIGKSIEIETIKTIITSLGITIEHEGHDALLLSIPTSKVDVTREQDVIEEVLRIYGYQNIEIPASLNASVSYSEKPDKEKIKNTIADWLCSNGFSEIMGLTLTKEEFVSSLNSLDKNLNVRVLNPLSNDLSVLRQTLLFTGLEAINYNQNRKQTNLKLFEFGKTYRVVTKDETKKYIETNQFSIFITGNKNEENWNAKNSSVDFYSLKGVVKALFERLGFSKLKSFEINSDIFSQAISIVANKKTIAELGLVSKVILEQMDLKNAVYYASINWDNVIEGMKNKKTTYSEVPKFPEVRRDLALLINKSVRFEELEQLAFETEKNILKSVRIFDVFEGDKLPTDKKSYALGFILQNANATLTDNQIEKTMEKLIKTFEDKVGAQIR